MKIGILALQGAFIEHIDILKDISVETVEVRLPKHLDSIDGLIIPGGESTTISRLIHEWKLYEPIRELAAVGKGIWGTCAGTILLAKKIVEPGLSPKSLQLMDITVERNAFGRQVDSFIIDINFAEIGEKPFTAVFIRAPVIKEIGEKAKSLITLDDNVIVAARQGKLLATAFHPELTGDDRFHRYFLQILQGAK